MTREQVMGIIYAAQESSDRRAGARAALRALAAPLPGRRVDAMMRTATGQATLAMLVANRIAAATLANPLAAAEQIVLAAACGVINPADALGNAVRLALSRQ